MSKPDKFKLKASHLAGVLILYYLIMPTILGSIFGPTAKFVANIITTVINLIVILFIFGLFFKTWNLYVFIYTGVLWLMLAVPLAITGFEVAGSVFSLLFLMMFLKNLVDLDKGRNLLYRRYIRALLELAAKPVDEVSDGYTGRPYPAGTYTCSKDELTRFARYLNYHLVAASYILEDKVRLVFSTGFFRYIPFLKPDFQKVTYADLDFQGNVSITIAKKDYEQYKEELTFDRLCNSLGNIIIGFLKDFQQGERKQIIKKLNKVKLPQPDIFVKRKKLDPGKTSG